MAVDLPAWVRELDMSLTTHPQILFVGNVRDQYLLPAADGSDEVHPMHLIDVIVRACEARHFSALASFDIVHDRLVVWPLDAAHLELPDSVRAMTEEDSLSGRSDDHADTGEPDGVILQRMRRVLREVVDHRGAPIGILFPYANRLGSARAELTGEGKLFMATAEALAYESRQVPGPDPVMPFNTVFWVTDSQDQLPMEFAMSARTVRVITIPKAPADQRLAAARQAVGMVMRVNGVPRPLEDQVGDAAKNLVSVTHGMTNAEVLTVGRVAIDQNIPVERLDEAARLYRVGVRDNPWATAAVHQMIIAGERMLSGSGDSGPNEASPIGVLGQDRAVRKAVEIFMRSAAGLSGAQSSSSPNRPRGVLFLAGPTGVGKTELAKGVARMIFGREAEPIRFDMSEFGQEHARERLIGAPPGFVGFDAGGELTNAVRASPMCVLLFDEIDKAHERLFDLFLQILEDGRLTDGRGSTVHFTECVLIFTSNLGMTEHGPGGSVTRPFTYTSDPEEVRRVLRQSFEDFFDRKIGRPELRNRLGDSFIAMDFIQPAVVPALLDKSLTSVAARVATLHQVRIDIAAEARQVLYDRAVASLEHGGRGVNNAVESLLINPLSRLILREPPVSGEAWTVRRILPDGTEWKIEVTRCFG
jgi:hypothetical protein